MYKKVLPLPLVVLTVLACQGGGGYRDMAMITDAERSLRGVKNALEEYWVDNGTYPGEGADLETVLNPYFLRVRTKENDDAAIHSAKIENASNQLENVSSMLANVKRQAEPVLNSSTMAALLSHMKKIEGLISQYTLEVEAIKIPTVNINTGDEFKEMLDILNGMKPDSLVSEIDNNLIGKSDEVVHLLDRLKDRLTELPLDSVRVTEAIDGVDAISSTFKVYDAYLTHQAVTEKQVVIPEREFANVEALLDTSAFDSSLMQIMEDVKQGINQYRSQEILKDDLTSLVNGIKGLKRAKTIMLKYEGTLRKDVQKSAKILKANVTLSEMAEAVENYKREHGSYPPEGSDIEPIIHSHFIEVTMGGDTIDRYEKNLSYLEEFPSYLIADPEKGFELRARVANAVGTPIFCRKEILSDWDKVISAFAGNPTYRTINPKVTYFLTARAKDSRNTLICERSPVRSEVKGKEEKLETEK